MKQIIDGAYFLPLGNANAVLLDGGSELTLVDAGFPRKADLVGKAVEQIGRNRADIRHLVLTHGHPDHIGSAARSYAKPARPPICTCWTRLFRRPAVRSARWRHRRN